MAPEARRCPACQSPVPPEAGPTHCPRCGGPLPAPEAEAANRRARRLTLAAVLGVMAVMAVVGLVLSLKTVGRRRAHDQTLLGYLPGDVHVVGAIHVAKLMEEKTGRDSLAEVRLGRGLDFAAFERWTGLGRDDIADLVAGVKLDAAAGPRLTLVVQTRPPYRQTKFWEALRDQSPTPRNGKDLFHLNASGVTPALTVWSAGPRTLIFGLYPEDLDAVPRTPYPGVEHLPLPLQRFPGDLQSGRAQVWVIGHAEHWDQTAAWPLVAPLLGPNQNLAKDVTTLGFWLRFEQTIAVGAAAHAASEPAARSLEQSLLRQGVGERGQLEVRPNGWLTFHTQASVGTLIRWGQGRW